MPSDSETKAQRDEQTASRHQVTSEQQQKLSPRKSSPEKKTRKRLHGSETFEQSMMHAMQKEQDLWAEAEEDSDFKYKKQAMHAKNRSPWNQR